MEGSGENDFVYIRSETKQSCLGFVTVGQVTKCTELHVASGAHNAREQSRVFTPARLARINHRFKQKCTSISVLNIKELSAEPWRGSIVTSEFQRDSYNLASLRGCACFSLMERMYLPRPCALTLLRALLK